NLHCHVAAHDLAALRFGYPPTELPALLDVGQRSVEGALGDTERLRADRQPGVVERAQRGLEAATRRADDAVGRDRAVGEVDRAGRAALDAELALLGADREARV